VQRGDIVEISADGDEAAYPAMILNYRPEDDQVEILSLIHSFVEDDGIVEYVWSGEEPKSVIARAMPNHIRESRQITCEKAKPFTLEPKSLCAIRIRDEGYALLQVLQK